MLKRVVLVLDAEDYDWIIGFDPDRDRSASRAQLVEVIEEWQDILDEAFEEEIEDGPERDCD